MKRILFSMLFMICCAAAVGQAVQKEIDSLSVLLDRHTDQDTVKVSLLTDVAFAYYMTDPAKGLEKAKQAVTLAGRLHYSRGLAMGYSRMGINYWAMGEHSQAMEASEKALHFYKVSGNLLGYAKALNNRALNEYALEDYTAAIHDHEEALDIFRKLNFSPGIQNSYNNMGVVFLALNDYPRALDAFLNANRISSAGISILQANIVTNIGLVYKNLKAYPKALSYQYEALKKYRALGNKQGVAGALGNIATIYDFLQDTTKALSCYRQALAINRSIGNKERIASDLTNIGVLYKNSGNPYRAAQYLQEAVSLYNQTSDKNDLSEALLALASASEGPTGNPAALRHARQLQLAALKAAGAGGSPLRESEALEALAKTYEQAGEPGLALKAYKRHILLRDTIFSKAKDQEILRKQLQFDFEQQQLATKAEIQRQKMLRKAIIAGSLTLMTILVAGFLLYKRKRDADNRKQVAEHKAMVAETELKVLRAQMNPHFIFNSLNAIRDYIAKNDKDTAQQYLLEFAGLMRKALENSHLSEVPLADDLEFIRQYLQVEARRLNNAFIFEIDIDPSVDIENTLIPPLLLQPFIENSIWHGISPKAGGGNGMIRVMIKKDNDMLLCTVEDNGAGRIPGVKDETKKRRSLGIELTKNRLAILNGKKQAATQLEVSENSNGEGIKVELSFPLKLAF